MAAIGLLVNSVALAIWNLVIPDAGDLSTLAVVYCLNGAVGLANFFILGRAIDGRASSNPRTFQVTPPTSSTQLVTT